MRSKLGASFLIEAGIAALSGCLAIITLFSRDWIEALTGWDPDQHNGSVEWLIVVGLALACGVLAFAARAEWRRLNPAGATPAG
jgi:hypothetical protein